MKMCFLAAIGAAVMTLPGAVSAQALLGTPAEALAEARQRLVCGTGTVVDATYLPGNQLRATCRARSDSPESLPEQLRGTELTAGTAGAAAAAALVVILIATGGDSDSTTTTATTVGSN
ncbi:MAG: hypothetical protein AAGF79_21210 [Pseudomonadota bacterium]